MAKSVTPIFFPLLLYKILLVVAYNLYDVLSFGDTNSIGSNYLNYVKLAYDKGLIGGYTDGTFKPKNTVTRAEMAAFLCRVEDKINGTSDNVIKGKVTTESPMVKSVTPIFFPLLLYKILLVVAYNLYDLPSVPSIPTFTPLTVVTKLG